MKKYGSDTCKRTKEIGFHKTLMAMDLFKAHFMDDVATMLIGHTSLVKVPPLQSLDVCVKKPFKSFLTECWEDHVVKVMKEVEDEANNNRSHINPSNNDNPSNNPKAQFSD